MNDGDILLIDCGVWYKGYSSDISPRGPSMASFHRASREVYSVVYEDRNSDWKRSNRAGHVHNAGDCVRLYQKHGLERFGLGRNCHPVGLNTEDAYYFGYSDYPSFKPDEVWAFEPMLMIPDESMGIRLEDGVLITDKGHDTFSRSGERSRFG